MSAMQTGFRGIYPMLYTFYDEGGAIERSGLVRQIEACIAGGVHGIALLGIVGEYNKLSVKEKLTIVEWSMEAVRGRLPVAVTVSEQSEPGQVEFAREVARLRPDWLILQPPAVRNVSVVLGGLRVQRVIGVGESQSAGRLGVYANAVHPRDRIYDGIIMSEGGEIICNNAPTKVMEVLSETEFAGQTNEISTLQDDTDIFRMTRTKTGWSEPIFIVSPGQIRSGTLGVEPSFTVTISAPSSGEDAKAAADALAKSQNLAAAPQQQFAEATWEVRSGPHTDADGVTRQTTLYVTLHDGEVYSIACTSPLASYSATNNLVYQPLLASFAFG